MPSKGADRLVRKILTPIQDMKMKYISAAVLAGAALLFCSCEPMYYGAMGMGMNGFDTSVAWTNASYDASGFPIYGYSYGRPVYGYTSAGTAIFAVGALSSSCYVPHWGPAPWYSGGWRYPARIHRAPAPPRFPSGHQPAIRPAGGMNAPIHRNPSSVLGPKPGAPVAKPGIGGFNNHGFAPISKPGNNGFAPAVKPGNGGFAPAAKPGNKRGFAPAVKPGNNGFAPAAKPGNNRGFAPAAKPGNNGGGFAPAQKPGNAPAARAPRQGGNAGAPAPKPAGNRGFGPRPTPSGGNGGNAGSRHNHHGRR